MLLYGGKAMNRKSLRDDELDNVMYLSTEF